jgi:outer membrane protein assembly factor BamD (BamD/ComL family)
MAQRLALIIGNSVYLDSTLSRLLTPDADVGALGELLLDPERGGFDDVKVMVNMSSHLIRRAIASFFAKKTRQDLLLLYFSGHGVLDDQGQLFLAVRDTDSQLLSGTAIPASYITTEMNNSHSQRQVLVLDCCHSGAFARGTKSKIGSSVGTGTVFEGTGYGRVVLTASDATQFAWEGEHVIGQADTSLFTHYLVEGIQSGKADLDADGKITVDELYDYSYEKVVRQTPRQTPGKWSYKEQGEIVLAKALSPASRGSQQIQIFDLDQDQEQRFEQLYNEGLSAYWLEEWDKAVRCFEALVEQRGDYLDAVNKLELSRRNKRLLALYIQAVTACEAGEWSQAIARLEELTSTVPDYKDAAARLDKARRARQLDNLYQEAKQLSQAEKWQAVVTIFANIAELEPGYRDSEGLLPAARLKVAEIERHQRMDDLYHSALREMDGSNWSKAQELLGELETLEAGYRGADRLLTTIKSKITEQQVLQERTERIARLYEDALVLLHARQWSQALDKMGELRRLESKFDDTEGIEKKAQAEIEREKAKAKRQIQLDANYAQAVQLLEARQYQQALEQWGQVQALDPSYTDRNKVQATAKKKLKELTKEGAPILRLPRWALAVIGVVVILGFILILNSQYWGNRPTEADMAALGTTNVFPIVDDFNNPQYEGSYNPELWSVSIDDPSHTVSQHYGLMVFRGNNIILHLSAIEPFPINGPYSLEARYMVNESSYGAGFGPGAEFGPRFHVEDGGAFCEISPWTDGICCYTYFFEERKELPCKTIKPGTWHWIRIDYMVPVDFDFYIDRKFIGTIQPGNQSYSWKIDSVNIAMQGAKEKHYFGYIDDFSFGPLTTP